MNGALIAVKVDLQGEVRSKTEIRITESIHPRARPRFAADLTGQCRLLALPFLVATRLPAYIFQKPAQSPDFKRSMRDHVVAAARPMGIMRKNSACGSPGSRIRAGKIRGQTQAANSP